MTRPRQEIIRGLHNLRPEHRGCVATIGSFDGVHRGHQVILEQVRAQAGRLGVPSLAMVFEPQPAEYFARLGCARPSDSENGVAEHKAPARLTRFREKAQALFDAGVNRVFCLRFNEALRLLPAADFVKKIIVEGLRPKYVVVGDDFHFGHDRAGEFAFLREAGRAHGFEVADTHTYEIQGERVSSTRVREVLAQGDFAFAEQLLGRPYAVTGHVSHGQQLGRLLGVRTANLPLHRDRSPLLGVFAVEVKLCATGEVFRGVANLGVRPTVGGTSRPVLETHLFDFERNIYGAMIEVVFKSKLRDEQAFESLELLKEQIFRDIEAAKRYFAADV